jgi:hypothetical protein
MGGTKVKLPVTSIVQFARFRSRKWRAKDYPVAIGVTSVSVAPKKEAARLGF